jgi:hypothetical protein
MCCHPPIRACPNRCRPLGAPTHKVPQVVRWDTTPQGGRDEPVTPTKAHAHTHTHTPHPHPHPTPHTPHPNPHPHPTLHTHTHTHTPHPHPHPTPTPHTPHPTPPHTAGRKGRRTAGHASQGRPGMPNRPSLHSRCTTDGEALLFWPFKDTTSGNVPTESGGASHCSSDELMTTVWAHGVVPATGEPQRPAAHRTQPHARTTSAPHAHQAKAPSRTTTGLRKGGSEGMRTGPTRERVRGGQHTLKPVPWRFTRAHSPVNTTGSGPNNVLRSPRLVPNIWGGQGGKNGAGRKGQYTFRNGRRGACTPTHTHTHTRTHAHTHTRTQPCPHSHTRHAHTHTRPHAHDHVPTCTHDTHLQGARHRCVARGARHPRHRGPVVQEPGGGRPGPYHRHPQENCSEARSRRRHAS